MNNFRSSEADQPVSGNPYDGVSLPVEVQLGLGSGAGQLRQGGAEISAAALLDLVLRGRLGSLPDHGFFARPNSRKLVVRDPTPTGDTTLDGALAVIAGKAAPMRVHKAMMSTWKSVAADVQAELIRRGIASRPAKFRSFHLTIVDERAHRTAVNRIDRAWLDPENVVDPRTGALIDLLRNAGEPFNRRRGPEPVIRWEWYPAELRETVLAILEEENLATSGASGTGYEG